MTAAFGSQLKIPGVSRPPEYHELYAFSIAKDLAKHGEYFTAHDLLLILCSKDWGKYQFVTVKTTQTIMDFMDLAEDQNTDEWHNYLESYKHNIERPEDHLKRYQELQKVRTAYDKLRFGNILLLAWAKYWTTNVPSDKVMDLISLMHESQDEPAFAPRSDLIDRELQNYVCYMAKNRFREAFLMAADDETLTENSVMTWCRLIFEQNMEMKPQMK